MTFEEFFAKKKIDLVQLEKAEPALYSEFKSHFSSMGEKSFDHTKKFWFNKLRRLYHLTHPEKDITRVESAIASQAEPLSSPTIEQKPAFTPRFKSGNIGKTETVSEDQSQKQPIAKPAFKPRNIPVKNTEPSAEVQGENKAENAPAVKPGFKPRNIQARQPEIKAEEANQEDSQKEKSEESSPVVRKPGFKPRNIKSSPDTNSADAQTSDSRPGQQGISEASALNLEEKKEAYKPKFKLKNIPKKLEGEEQTGALTPEEVTKASTQDHVEQANGPDIERKISSSTENKTIEQEIQDNEVDLRGSDVKSNEEKPKPAYKPKFNLKNIKPKSGE